MIVTMILLSRVRTNFKQSLNSTADEVQRAMEEIVEKESDLKQLAQVTNMLYDRNKELQK